jgi:predicted DNA-binding transcriptional regulator AlpA
MKQHVSAEGRAAPDPQALLWSAKDLALALRLSVASVRRMDSAGRLPKPALRSPGCVRWLRTEIEAWAAARCPDQVTWEGLRRSGQAGRNGAG